MRVWRDWVLLAAGLVGAGLETALRGDVVLWPVSLLVTLVLYAATLWRRTHPLAMVALAFGTGIVLTLVDVAANHDRPLGLYSGMVVLILVYSLTRWGSGRDIILGGAVTLASFTLSLTVDELPASDVLGSLVFLALPAILGLSVRMWSTSRERDLDRMRARERAALARELHDTVAHHVAAIVVRAQAGRVLAAATDPGGIDPKADAPDEPANDNDQLDTGHDVGRENAAGNDDQRFMDHNVGQKHPADNDDRAVAAIASDQRGDALQGHTTGGSAEEGAVPDRGAATGPEASRTEALRAVMRETLEGVEEEGARTLEAMRAMVAALRDEDTRAEMTPVAGVADLQRLTRGPAGRRLAVDLWISPSAQRLPAAVDAAVYRIVQESLTNAARHAVDATRVEVRVDSAAADRVRVTVRDDGSAVRRGRGRGRDGYGLTGLRERASLLGGSLSAGPCPGHGWLVEAELPRTVGNGRRSARAEQGPAHERQEREPSGDRERRFGGEQGPMHDRREGEPSGDGERRPGRRAGSDA
ncbi:ATP-binding protein [Dactylosporangium sp. CS-047395]|uniref:sensor histidine kinase n=1 Tax=Dactylosporangium sp. CS-047395 TaxID=3239936 RepID=UPI003D931B12